MISTEINLKELKRASQQWKEKIANLLTQVEGAKGSQKSDAFELIEQLKQQQAIIDQYVKQVEDEEGGSWEKKVSELDHMLKDIDATYREVLSYLY